MTEKLNTNSYPILDICSIEIPDGETLPETMPLLSLDMIEKLSKNVEKNLSSVGENSTGNNIQTIDDFPKLHNVHIRHRIPHSTTTASTESLAWSTTTTTATPASTSEFTPNVLSEDDTLEILEEIDFMSKVPTESNDGIARRHHDTFRPFHHLRRHRDRLGVVSVPEFKPIHKRVVMSRRNLMETLQEMISRQEENLESERHFISSELTN
jgi:hypothetical protein